MIYIPFFEIEWEESGVIFLPLDYRNIDLSYTDAFL